MLTKEDVDLLLDALDAWEKESSSTAMTTGMLGLMLSGDKKEGERAFKTTMEEAERKCKQRERKAILLKAKLVQMQDEFGTEQLFTRVLVGEKED